MTRRIITLTGAPLDLASVVALADGRARAVIAPDALARVSQGRAAFLDALASGQAIYGTTTGVGALKDTTHEGRDLIDYSRALPFAHQVAVGAAAPDRAVRLTLVQRLNTLLSGQTGATVELAAFLEAMLAADLLPVIGQRGSIGCGDLGQMGALACVMSGFGPVRLAGQPMTAAEALEKIGLTPHPMSPRDGLAAVASNSFGVATAALAVHRTGAMFRRALAVASLGAQALGLNRDVWAGAASAGLPTEQRIARWLLATNVTASAWPHPARVHDPLSGRMLAQVFGATLDALETAAKTICAETSHVCDNPLVLDGRVVTSGGSLLLTLALHLAGVQFALAHLARNILNRCLLMTGGQMEGLTINLVPPGHVATGFGPVMKLALEQAVRVATAATPISALNVALASGLEDEAAFIPLTAERISEQLDAIDWLIAIEAMVSAQALDLQGVAASGCARIVYDTVRAEIPFLTHDLPQSEPLTALARTMTDDRFCAALVACCPLSEFDTLLGLAPDIVSSPNDLPQPESPT